MLALFSASLSLIPSTTCGSSEPCQKRRPLSTGLGVKPWIQLGTPQTTTQNHLLCVFLSTVSSSHFTPFCSLFPKKGFMAEANLWLYFWDTPGGLQGPTLHVWGWSWWCLRGSYTAGDPPHFCSCPQSMCSSALNFPASIDNFKSQWQVHSGIGDRCEARSTIPKTIAPLSEWLNYNLHVFKIVNLSLMLLLHLSLLNSLTPVN